MVNGVVIGTFQGGTAGTALVFQWNNRATPSTVQTVLRRVAFATAGEDPSALTRTVTVQIADGDGGQGIVSSKDIAVVRRNDAPVITIPVSGPLNYQLGATPGVTLLAGANIADPDSSNFEGGRLSVKIISGTNVSNRVTLGGRISIVGSAVMLDGTTQLGTVNTNGGVGTTRLYVDLVSTATQANVVTLLQSLRFSTVGTSILDDRLIEVTLTDGDGATSNTVLRTVKVTA
jgi:hypothetical protein